MKTENTNTTETGTMNNETLNTPTAETSTVTAGTTEATGSTAPDNAKRLAELAVKIRDAYAAELDADGMVVDWKAKQLKAGIEMGEYLIEAKKLVPPKGFIKWCEATFADLNQRTLSRYMKLARNKTLVSEATGLKEAYNTISAAEAAEKSATTEAAPDAAGESEGLQANGQGVESQQPAAPVKDEESELQKDLKKVTGYLTKAKDILNDYQDIAASKQADAVCDLIDALAGWVSEYRKAEDNLHWLPPANAEVSLDEDTATPEHNAEYATA